MLHKILILTSFFIFSCNTNELKVDSITSCAFIDENGNCEKPLNEKKVYTFSITKDLKVDNMGQLSNYLNYKSRISTGYVIKFNRKFLFQELDEIKASYKVYYNFSGTVGRVENSEFGDDFIFSYVYLGDILKEKNREKKEEQKNIGKSQILLFPGTFTYESTLFNGETSSNQEITITKD